MISTPTIDIVKSTAPLLGEHGETLTRHFYQRMFSHNPEVAPFFNPAHQAAGLQQKALAGAICAYAANIDNLEGLGSAVEWMAQKHASLQIKPEHYPIVGANLLASIREVLGEEASDEVMNAWAEAYGYLASILIGREKHIYQDHAQQPGGWAGFRIFRIARKEAESDVITSFYLTPEDGRALPAFQPGQYITVRVPGPCGQTTMRNYSLSDKPRPDWFRISVKREKGTKAHTPDGYVSNLFHDKIDIGTAVEIGPPCGAFFLNLTDAYERPLVLLAAGVGITPILSILLSALEATPEREVVFIHGCLNEDVQAFKPTIDALAANHANLKIHYRYSGSARLGVTRTGNVSTGFVDAALIDSMVSDRDADYYLCGPTPFMARIDHKLLAWGIPETQVHSEFFGPRQELKKSK
jgi:nitric oxide dioxygenase